MRWLNNKKPSKPALRRFYLSILPDVRKAAVKSGYALGVHGSMTRDLDLIAAPWTPRAVAPVTLAWRIHDAATKRHWPKPRLFIRKPHGRVGYVLYVGTRAYIDLSVMPQIPPKAVGRPR